MPFFRTVTAAPKFARSNKTSLRKYAGDVLDANGSRRRRPRRLRCRRQRTRRHHGHRQHRRRRDVGAKKGLLSVGEATSRPRRRLRAPKTKKSRRRPTLARAGPALPSAKRPLTSVFGMGTGMTASLWPPAKNCRVDGLKGIAARQEGDPCHNEVCVERIKLSRTSD